MKIFGQLTLLVAYTSLSSFLTHVAALQCYKCHNACNSARDTYCHWLQVYLNSIEYNTTLLDGPECPKFNWAKYDNTSSPLKETCENPKAFCGQRTLTVTVNTPSMKLKKFRRSADSEDSTEYPILNPHNAYYTVYGCFVPEVDCNKKKLEKTVYSGAGSPNATIRGKIDGSKCNQCQKDLCNSAWGSSDTTATASSTWGTLRFSPLFLTFSSIVLLLLVSCEHR